MKCPVCGKKSQHIQCPDCGFDSSRDYEKYPTLAPVGKASAISALQKQWEQQKKTDKVIRKKRPWLALIACAAILVLGIGVGIDSGKPVSTEPTVIISKPGAESWRDNVLRSDELSSSASNTTAYTVLGSQYRREEIQFVIFLDTLAYAPENAWDVSENSNGKVLAWVTSNGKLYTLYIAAEGGIAAGKSCKELFAGYVNVQEVYNMNYLHCENVQDMSGMFYWCRSLTSLDLSSFDTSNVKGMSSMFANCTSLTSLDLSSFDTSNVKWMRFMFVECSSLISLDLSNFDTSNVQAMNQMFDGCSSLTSLDLSSFDTSNVQDMRSMFDSCGSLTSLDLSSFDTTNVQNMRDMFSRCGSLTSLDLSGFDTANVRDMSVMFYNCSSLTSLDLSSFDTSNVQDMRLMFYSCPAGDDWQHLLK